MRGEFQNGVMSQLPGGYQALEKSTNSHKIMKLNRSLLPLALFEMGNRALTSCL